MIRFVRVYGGLFILGGGIRISWLNPQIHHINFCKQPVVNLICKKKSSEEKEFDVEFLCVIYFTWKKCAGFDKIISYALNMKFNSGELHAN